MVSLLEKDSWLFSVDATATASGAAGPLFQQRRRAAALVSARPRWRRRGSPLPWRRSWRRRRGLMGLLPPAPRCLFHLSPPGLLSSGSRGLGAGAAGGAAGPAPHGASLRCVALFLSLLGARTCFIQAASTVEACCVGLRSTVSIRPKTATTERRGVDNAADGVETSKLASGL